MHFFLTYVRLYLRHELNTTTISVCFLSFGKNACSISHAIAVEVCVATSGVVHFSCAASVAHFFNLRGKNMNIKLELLRDFLCDRIEDFEIDASEIADTTAIRALEEIQAVIQNEKYSDFEAIEEIVCIFEKYNIDSGSRHDF